MKIKEILNETSRSENHIIATEQHLQNEIHEYLCKTQNFHAAKFMEVAEKLNDESKVLVDRTTYEKQQAEYQATLIKLQVAEKNAKVMKDNMDQLHYEMETYTRRLSKR